MKIAFSVLPSENMNTHEYLFLKKEENLLLMSNNDFKHVNIYIHNNLELQTSLQ